MPATIFNRLSCRGLQSLEIDYTRGQTQKKKKKEIRGENGDRQQSKATFPLNCFSLFFFFSAD